MKTSMRTVDLGDRVVWIEKEDFVRMGRTRHDVNAWDKNPSSRTAQIVGYVREKADSAGAVEVMVRQNPVDGKTFRVFVALPSGTSDEDALEVLLAALRMHEDEYVPYGGK